MMILIKILANLKGFIVTLKLYGTTIDTVSLDGQTLPFADLLPKQQKKVVQTVVTQVLKQTPRLKSYLKGCGERHLEVAFSSTQREATIALDHVGSIAVPLDDKAMTGVERVFRVFRYYQNAGVLDREPVPRMAPHLSAPAPASTIGAKVIQVVGTGMTGAFCAKNFASGGIR